MTQSSDFENLRAAAEGGDPAAMHDLAGRLERGDGTVANVRNAAKYFRQAAEAGHVEAMAAMARLSFLGKGVVQDSEEAADWIKKAAEAGLPTPNLIWEKCTHMDVSSSRTTLWLTSGTAARRHKATSKQ